jgi:hypothetical protein
VNATRAARCTFFVSYGAARYGDLRPAYERGRRSEATRRPVTASPPAADA